jgi:hypothetical protein
MDPVLARLSLALWEKVQPHNTQRVTSVKPSSIVVIGDETFYEEDTAIVDAEIAKRWALFSDSCRVPGVSDIMGKAEEFFKYALDRNPKYSLSLSWTNKGDTQMLQDCLEVGNVCRFTGTNWANTCNMHLFCYVLYKSSLLLDKPLLYIGGYEKSATAESIAPTTEKDFFSRFIKAPIEKIDVIKEKIRLRKPIYFVLNTTAVHWTMAKYEFPLADSRLKLTLYNSLQSHKDSDVKFVSDRVEDIVRWFTDPRDGLQCGIRTIGKTDIIQADVPQQTNADVCGFAVLEMVRTYAFGAQLPYTVLDDKAGALIRASQLRELVEGKARMK